MGAISSEVRVLANEPLGAGVFLLTFERPAFSFRPGQYLSLGIPGHREQREYSVYSAPSEPVLSVLVKEVPEGLMSRRLAALGPQDRLLVDGPFGYFTLGDGASTPYLFVATGTGISPFHSMVLENPTLDYSLLHGIRTDGELALERDFDPSRVISCVSRGTGGQFLGRVTDRLKDLPLRAGTQAYLCGNCDMIYEVFDLLQARGIGADQIHTEVYF